MRLLWLSPLHGHSAIARFSELVLRALQKAGCDIAVGSTEVGPSPAPPRPFLDHWSVPANVIADLDDQFDAIIVNFGDHFPNHGLGLDALGRDRVIGIFHDADMVNFGNGMRAAGRSVDLLPPDGEGRAVTAAIAKRCSGAVAHASHYRDVIEACDGPLTAIPLAWTLPYGAAAVEHTDGGDDLRPDEPLRLVTFGNINPNKCADRVIEAIAKDDALRARVNYRLVGAIDADERERLTAMASTAGVRLTVLGPVDDDALHEELRRADMISCLREPVLEGASASAIEAMLHGRAVLVSDAGFYVDLPDECVAKVPAATEAAAIGAVLARLADDKEQRDAIGRRAQAHATEAFAPARYAQALLRLIDEMRISSAYAPTLDRMADALTALGIEPDEAATSIIIGTLEASGPVLRRTDPGQGASAVSNAWEASS